MPEKTADGKPVAMPYITYTIVEPEWNAPASHQARVWYRGESYEELDAKVDEIAAAVPAGRGVLLPAGNGYLWLNRASPWAQLMPTVDRHLKVAYINLQLNAYTE